MSLNNAYTFLLSKSSSIVTSYSEIHPENAGTCAVFRCVGGNRVSSLLNNVLHVDYVFNCFVRGTNNSVETVTLVDSLINALHLADGITSCVVTTEPALAYVDDNGIINYTFNIELIL